MNEVAPAEGSLGHAPLLLVEVVGHEPVPCDDVPRRLDEEPPIRRRRRAALGGPAGEALDRIHLQFENPEIYSGFGFAF